MEKRFGNRDVDDLSTQNKAESFNEPSNEVSSLNDNELESNEEKGNPGPESIKNSQLEPEENKKDEEDEPISLDNEVNDSQDDPFKEDELFNDLDELNDKDESDEPIEIEPDDDTSEELSDDLDKASDKPLESKNENKEDEPVETEPGDFDENGLENDDLSDDSDYDPFHEAELYQDLDNIDNTKEIDDNDIPNVDEGEKYKKEIVDPSKIDMSTALGMDDPNFWNHHGNTYEGYLNMAKNIPEVQRRLDGGESLDSLKEDSELRDTAYNYFDDKDMVRVLKDQDGNYAFSGDGRHRIEAAKEAGVDMPAKIQNVVNDGNQESGNDSKARDESILQPGLGENKYSMNDSSHPLQDDEQNFDYKARDESVFHPELGENRYSMNNLRPEEEKDRLGFVSPYFKENKLGIDDLKNKPESTAKEYYEARHPKDLRMGKYEKYAEKDAKDLDFNERRALDNYSGDGYEDINNYLRGKDISEFKTDMVKENINAISKVLDRKQLDKPMMLYRGVKDAEPLLGEGWQEKSALQLNNELKGTPYSDNAFISTSVRYDKAEKFANTRNGAIMVIRAPEGANGMVLGSVSAIDSDKAPESTKEREVLLQKESCFRIDKVTKDEFGRPTVYCTLIGRK